MSTQRTAAALVIGNELLSGKIADANTVVLAKTLQRCGVRLSRVVTVPDDIDIIANEVLALGRAHDVLFTSGGVGPTHDDVTIDAIALAFGVDVVSSEGIEAMLREYYGDALTAGHLRMARVPNTARLVVTEHMPWPTIVVGNVWILPGVPEIFAMKMPVVLTELGGAPVVSLALFTTLDEGHLKPHLDAVVSAHPTVEIGSYPKWRHPAYRTKITFDALDEGAAVAARAALLVRLPEATIVNDVEE